MPGKSLKQLLTICDTNQFDCKFLFLVRDPRAIIPSSKATSLFADDTSLEGTRDFSQEICNTTEMNLNIIRSLPSVEKRQLLLLRYEDLAVDPLKKLPSLLKFAGVPMDESATKWLDLASHRPESEMKEKLRRGGKTHGKGHKDGPGKLGLASSMSLKITAIA